MHKGRIALLVVAVVAVLLGIPATRARAAGPTFTDVSGIPIHVVGQTTVDSRQYNVQMTSPALGTNHVLDVRVLLPTSYDTDTTARYPVLYLFHGTSGRASDWVTFGAAETTTAPLNLITVMPDAGFNGNGGGWFTDWVDTATTLGPSEWETFHVSQLIPWVDANLRTVATRSGRAVAGLSQGGFGSTTYAARHPDTFLSVASFSGAPDIDYNPVTAVGATMIIEATAFGLDGVEPEAMFGSRATNEINWQGHDPADLVTNLKGTDVRLWTGSGQPGTGDPFDGAAMGIEAATHGSTLSFTQRAQMKGVPYQLNDYGAGIHTWKYWTRDLQQYAPQLMTLFGSPPAPPAPTQYESIDKTWSQWGWSVALSRSVAQQFSSLTGAGAGGFTLAGTGTAAVVTPALYAPNSPQSVTMATTTGSTTTTVAADGAGQLHLTVPLGPDVPGAGGAAVMGVPDVPPWPSTTVTVHPA
ncbi:MAG TPA: alpha/beta hydrolase family protein [Acidimicrobiales bacterium]|nr:alpha/beta hydrolase family protein [Acidimicrobiales bacterium]